jgi:tetratricopeptide (TPR) repeat protein
MNISTGASRRGTCLLTPHILRLLIVLAFLAGILCIPASATSIPATPALMDASDYEHQGMALMAEKNWSGLMAIVDEGLALYPEDAELFCLKGYALRKTGQYQEAVDIVSRAIERDPKPVRYANRGYGLLALGCYQDALSDADTAISLDSSYTTAYCVRAIALLGLCNYSEAQQSIGTAISLDPKNAFYWQVQGNVYARSGNCTGAVEAFGRSIELNPDSDLPWPGLVNATTDLERTEAECAARSQMPARAASPAVLAGVALGVAMGLRRW